MRRRIHLCLDCADACAATARVVGRQTGGAMPLRGPRPASTSSCFDDPHNRGGSCVRTTQSTSLARTVGPAALPVRARYLTRHSDYLDLVRRQASQHPTARPRLRARPRANGAAARLWTGGFDPLRCRHAAECVRGLPPVFDIVVPSVIAAMTGEVASAWLFLTRITA